MEIDLLLDGNNQERGEMESEHEKKLDRQDSAEEQLIVLNRGTKSA